MVVSEILDTNMTFVRPQKAENTDARTDYAVKYATDRGHLSHRPPPPSTILVKHPTKPLLSRDKPKGTNLRGQTPICGFHSLLIYPYPMVWPLPRPWSETMVSIPL